MIEGCGDCEREWEDEGRGEDGGGMKGRETGMGMREEDGNESRVGEWRGE